MSWRTAVKRPAIIARVIPLTALIGLALFSQGCSWLSKRRAAYEQDVAATSSNVSREDHLKLQKRFDELAERYSHLQAELASQSQGEMLSELGKVPAPELAETVDVFAKQQSPVMPKAEAKSQTAGLVMSSNDIDPDLVEEHISILRKSQVLISQNRFDEGLREIKKIENSPVRQIRVRAKFNLGEILFNQQEFDLALQIYEEIIKQEAFSGIVLKTLGRLIVCTENLKLTQKRDTYFSILNDFFEQT